MRNFKKLGFPISVVLDEGRPTLRNSLMKLRAGCLVFLRWSCLGFLEVCLLMWFVVKRLLLVDRMVWVGGSLRCCLFHGLMVFARILSCVEDFGVWPDGLLDAYIALIPKVGGDVTPLVQRPLSVLPVVYRIWASARMGQLEGWFRSWVLDSVFSAGGGRSSVEAWHTTALDIEEVLSGCVDSNVPLFVADVVKSFDTVDRGVFDSVLSSLGLPGCFRHAYFEFHSHARLRFKLATGVGQPWTRDGCIPLSMMFIVALYLPWCRYLGAQVGVQPQLYADNIKCVSRDPGVLLRAARFTTGYVRLVGQEPAPSKCVHTVRAENNSEFIPQARKIEFESCK